MLWPAPNSLLSPWPTRSIILEGGFLYINISRPVILLFSLVYARCTFLIFRIQEETYWNNFTLSYSEQYNTIHIYEQVIFKQRPCQANNHQKKTTLKIISLFGSEPESTILAVPYMNASFCANVHCNSSTPFGGDGALNLDRSMHLSMTLPINSKPLTDFTGYSLVVCRMQCTAFSFADFHFCRS